MAVLFTLNYKKYWAKDNVAGKALAFAIHSKWGQ